MVIFAPYEENLGLDMSVGLYETENFIWNPQTDCLGEGAYGKVYRGTNKKTGDRVAVKTFKHVNQQVSQETKMLQTLKHEYIIQLLAVEIELMSRNLVIVMELCNGGSLMQFLNEPENVGGLCDEDFLLVVEHLTGGLEYLKRHDVIHRDVKPDNIMRHVLDDGHTIYKLADFGTARELPEGQNFTSLHGTEPYLHPNLYKVCFFYDAHLNRQFGSNTDLWSIGVTMFHIATGSLPFRVYDRRVMRTIFNEMQRNEGIISGVQEMDSDRVVYKKKLPETTRLSHGLRQLVTPIIAGLFIHDDHQNQWTFTRYYDEVQQLMSSKLMKVFHVNTMQMLKVYVKPVETFEDFQRFVHEQCGVSSENQVFLYKKKLVANFSDDLPCDGGECVFLFDRTSASVEPKSNTQLVYQNLSDFKTKFINSPDDVRLAFMACRDLGVCKQLMEYQCMVIQNFNIFIKDFHDYCKEELKEQHKNYDNLLEKYSSTSSTFKILEKIKNLSQSDDSGFTEDFEKVTNSFVSQASKILDNLSKIKSETDFSNNHDSYLKTTEKELADMKLLNKNLIKLKISNRQLYDCEKIKIVHCVHTILSILTDKMEPQFEVFVNRVRYWYKQVFFTQVRMLSALKRHSHSYRCDLKTFEKAIHTETKRYLDCIMNSRERVLDEQKLITTLRNYKLNSANVDRMIEENCDLVTKMNELVSNLSLDIVVPSFD